jgi:phosphoglycolate phosphatase
MMRFSAVLFDLDGTLLDTLQDLADSANEALARHGFPAHPRDAYRYFVGDGVAMLFLRALPPEGRRQDVIAHCSETFREVYGWRWNALTRPYDGILELLRRLTARQVALAVLSNKPDDFTRRCVAELLPGHAFAVVLGQRPEIPLKPDPTGALEIRERLGVPSERIAYVGDTATDMQTAMAAGMFRVGALWGFRTRAELLAGGAEVLISHPLDLLEVVAG